ncbi:hypothetical protein BH23ACT11_BH23ACT11_11350 [soil metagenome]
MVQDAYDVGGVGVEAVARLGFSGVAATPQVYAHEFVFLRQVQGEVVEDPVLGGDAVDEYERLVPLPAAPDREFYIAGYAFTLPEVHLTRLAFPVFIAPGDELAERFEVVVRAAEAD